MLAALLPAEWPVALDANLLIFLALVAFGATVQTITGFAMGLMIIAGVAALNLTPISFAAAVISLISLLQTLIALRRARKHVNRQFLTWISVGLAPMLILGVFLLDFLSDGFYGVLRTLLGVVIIAAGFMLMVTPQPWEKVSSTWQSGAVGALGGVIAGLYSAGGAPLAYFMYRQPLPLDVVRATLLAIFAASTLWRTIVVGVTGHVTVPVLTTAALAIPVVVVTTLVVQRYLDRIPDRIVRRMVFVLLIGLGVFLIAT